ncbi:unnamed protein product [Prorocentrum cordatum]|uniref:EF-hand domain-containing protein n=1 Tax=Prorocentrum cordatum TaxID=2364126 RepID=A0ABN9XT53_9DINO|nr:unnamed protein product [Polarella glacialis]
MCSAGVGSPGGVGGRSAGHPRRRAEQLPGLGAGGHRRRGEDRLAGKGPLPSVVACIVESFIRRVRVSVDDVEIVIRGQKVPEIRVAASVDLRTTHCRVIERRGAAARARLRLSASVGGGALLPGLEVELQRLELPRVLQTLLAPKPLPAKKVSAELLVKRIELEVRPHVVSALMQVSHIFSQFSEWREAMAEEVRGTALPLKPGEKEEYEKALSGRQDVSGWEQRMSAQEILCSHCEAKRWPVPEDMGLQEWIDKLTDEQRPVRAMEISAEVQSLVLELLGDSDLPGRGVLASAVSLCARVGVLDPQVPQDAAGSDSRSPSAAGSPSAASSDGRSPSAASGQLGAFDSGLLRDIGPKKLEARASLGSLEVTCDPPGSLAVPVLEPCLVSAECALHASSSRDTLLLRTECRRALATGEGRDAAVTFNLSGHALWRVQQVLQAMGAAAAAQSMPSEAVDLESERLAAQARASAKRRAAHMADVKRIFDQLDRDRSGSLESDEVDELVASLYGSLMTLEEVKVAGGHLMQMVDTSGDGAVEAQELQDFFLQQNSSESVGTYGPICPNLGDFVVPVPESINLTDTFRRCVCPSFAEDAHGEHAEVLQLRWVRALQNYKVAEATWSETIAPRMEPRFSAWKLHERIPAIDFWNDPTFSLKKLDVSAEHEQRDTTLLCNVDMPGLSLRLADSQHASAMARIRIDVHHLTLSGGVQTSANMDTLKFQGLSGNFSMRAGYWNQQHRLVEPFVEPWSLKFEADGNCARVLADHHMVINVTPPLLQALCVAASSLEAAEVPSTAGAVPAEEDVRPVVAYVLNRTFLDVNVSAHGPHGAGKTVRIERACFDQRVAVEIERERGTSIHRLESGGEQKLWTLTLEGADPLNPWQLDGEITFSVTGRTTFRDVSRKRLIVVDVSVDVRSRAPIVTLSGICRLQNTTGRTLVMSDPEKAFAIKVNPGESREAGVGGGFEVTLFNFESSEVSIPIVTAVMPADEEEIQEDTKQWCGEASGLQRVDCSVVGGGYKFLLLQQRKLVGDSPANDRTLLCVPMLRVLNGLPCEIKILRGAARRAPEGEQRPWLRHFAARRGTPDVPERSQSAEVLTVASGETRGCGDIDPSQPIFLHVDALSFSYTAVIPKDAIHSPHAVRQASRARKQSRAALTSDEAGAPRLEIELGWEGFGAMVTVYARHWVLNKTGWAMEVHSGPEVPKVGRLPEQINLDLGQESMAPAPLAGAPWSAALGAAPPAVACTGPDAGPDVAFLRAPDHKFRLRLRGRPRVSRWAWDSHAEGAELRHWIPGATAPALAPPASNGEGLPPAWESGWSQPLETEIAGTAGEASLPACEAAGGAAFPGGSLGVSSRGAVAAGLRALDRALLWPKWRLQLVDLSLPDVWMERRVRSLVVSLVHEGDQAESDVRVVRGRMADGWALQGGAWLCGTPLGGGGPPAGLAEGRTGLLRGPFRIQVEALVEGNLEMTVPFRVVIGQGELPLGDFSDAMLRPLRQEAQQLRFCVRALPSPIMGPGFSQREGELIGEVTACLAPCVDRKVMPPRFLPDADAARGLPKLGPAAAAGPDRGARAAAGPDPAEPLVRMASMASAAGAAAPPAVVRVASGRPRGAPQ